MTVRRAVPAFLVAVALWMPTLAQDSGSTVTIHVVQRGENLFRISLQYGTTVDELARLNGILDPASIEVGQRLLVPSNSVSTATIPQTHMVQPGETLRSIAELYGITVDELAASNEIADVNTIFVGEILTIGSAVQTIPAFAPLPTNESPPPNLIYVVQPGETLFRIATQHGLTVNELVQANSISDPTLIFAGQQLIIPGVEPPTLALDLPAPIQSLQVNPLILAEGNTGRFRMTTAAPVSVSASFLGHPLTVVSERENTLHTMLVGVPVFTGAGIYSLTLSVSDATGQTSSVDANVQIVSGGYGSESITLLEDRAGLLDPAVEHAEQDLVQNIMSAFTPTRYFDGPLGLPAAATVISPFGTRRSYNGGGFDRFHSGTDFAGAPGTPVLAAGPGLVVLADSLNIRGNATIIDHGWGVFTGYWHQAEQFVRVGDVVAAGQAIGTIGASGRVSGAHLHWELWVSGVPVDPMQWVRQSFT
jgi:murein DD-endopeptidase MepM/ murein hydrolase activator NlpD